MRRISARDALRHEYFQDEDGEKSLYCDSQSQNTSMSSVDEDHPAVRGSYSE